MGFRTRTSGGRSCCRRSRRWWWRWAFSSPVAGASGRASPEAGCDRKEPPSGSQARISEMNENAKTIFFVAVAVVVSLGVWINRPRLRVLTSDKALPAVLFAGFDDPLSAASLEIVQFNESTATLRPFKVAQVDDKWSIPSHENYPADAENQLAEVAAGP